MRERENLENKKVDKEIISNIEEKFDRITNPDIWLQHGFESSNNQQHENKGSFIYLNDKNNSLNIYEQQKHQQQQQQQQQSIKQFNFNRNSSRNKVS